MKKFKNTLLLIILLTLALTFPFACGGGGGGGGGAAAGPAASAGGSSSGSSTSAPVLSAEAEILTFEFKKDLNETAFEGDSAITIDNVSSDLVGIIDSANATVVVKYPFDTLPDKSALIPEITVSANASVSPESGSAQDFSEPVTYNVTAQNGAVKRWTVTFEQLDPNEHSITYHIEGDTSSFRHSFNEGENITLAVRKDVTKLNYCFDGWYEDENLSGSPIEGWYPHEKTADVELWPKWLPAPRVDTASHTVYTNGRSVIVRSENGTSIYYDLNNDGAFDADDVNLTEIDPAHTDDFTSWNVKAGNHPDAAINPECTSLPNAKIAITGGMLQDVEASATTNVWLSGNPIIGDKNQHGIRLSTCPGNIVKMSSSLTGINNNITLIAADSLSDEDVVAKSEGGNYANADKFILRNADGNDTYEIKVANSDVVVNGSVGLPDKPYTQDVDANGSFFTLGGGHVSAKGTIFSVFVDGDNAFFMVPSSTIEGGTFDMAILYDKKKNGNLDYIDGENASISTSTKLQYIQFKSEAGNLSPKKVSEYFGKIKFYGSNVKVNINLQTVPWSDIHAARVKNPDGVTYFNGSFYEVVKSGRIKWDTAYTEAKGRTFDGLKGYLITITSKIENMFIFDRVYKNTPASEARGWIGATRSAESTPDADTWSHAESSTNFRNDWIWACGPEAGTVFWNKAKGNGGAVAEQFAAWDNLDCRWTNKTWGQQLLEKPTNPKTGEGASTMYQEDAKFWPAGGTDDKNKWYVDWKEPNNDKGKEAFAQYLGIYSWNDQSVNPTNAAKAPISYIVEFTEYGSQIAAHPALKADKTYSR